MRLSYCSSGRSWEVPARRSFALVAVLLLHHGLPGLAANWAELTGPTLTNVATNPRSDFTPRWGAAAAVIEGDAELDEPSKMYLLGGDDYKEQSGGGSYHNDVWFSSGPDWTVVTNLVETTIWGDVLPKMVSRAEFLQVAPDRVPANGLEYHEWLCCATSKWDCVDVNCFPRDPFDGIRRWSPRRNHAAVTLEKTVFVLGGRARDLQDLQPAFSNGGIIGERGRWRERSVLRNDVWSTTDGLRWALVNPGCSVPQADQVLENGVSESLCRTDSDCFAARLGDAICERGRCVCQLWSARERHAATVFNNQIYVMGGATWVETQKCGRLACGGGYRKYMNDVWSSEDGERWTAVNLQARWPGRGDFGVAVVGTRFWIGGGRGGDVHAADANPLFNDLWTSDDFGKSWRINTTYAPWSPRAGHGFVSVGSELLVIGGVEQVPPDPPAEPRTPEENAATAAQNAPEVVVDGDEIEEDAANHDDVLEVNGMRLRLLDEVWTWDLSKPVSSWTQDFSNSTVQRNYLRESQSIDFLGLDSSLTEALRAAGVEEVGQLADMEKDAVGYTHKVMTIKSQEGTLDLCRAKRVAEALMQRCRVQPLGYDGEFINDVVIIEGDAAAQEFFEGIEEVDDDEVEVEIDDPDGCAEEDEAGLAPVTAADVDVVCRWQWAPRRASAITVMSNLVVSIAGFQGREVYGNDVWYRDARLPNALITLKPTTLTSETVFRYEADESVVLFEYRFLILDEETQLLTGDEARNWTLSTGEVDFLEWLDGGLYTFQVRAIDPAGNRDAVYEEGRNAHTWEYIPALPWALIISLILTFILLVAGGILEWRRRRKKAAMERYAIKRMRRKFKGIQKGQKSKDVDWRNYYDEAKTGGRGKDMAKKMAKELEKQAASGTKKKKKKKKAKTKDGKKKKEGKKKKDGKKGSKKKEGKKKDGKRKKKKKK